MARDNELQVFFTLNDRAFKKGVKDSKKALDGFGNAVKNIGLTLGARELARFGIEASRTAGKVRAVELAFNKLNGVSLDELRRATKGTISDLELMQKVNLAGKLGLDVSRIASLFQFAARTAQETGQSIDHMVNSLVIGIGRKSTRVLDNLGISAIDLRKQLGGVAVESASIPQLMDAIGRIAKDSLGGATQVVDTTEVSVNQLDAAWQNFIASFGAKASPAFDTVVKGLTSVINKINELYETTGQQVQRETAVFVADFAKKFSEGIISKEDIQKRINDLESSLKELNEIPAKLFTDDTEATRRANERAVLDRNLRTGEIRAQINGLQDLLKELNKVTTTNNELTEDQQKIYDKFQKQLALVNADIQLFGERTTNLEAAIRITKDAMVAMTAEGLSPQSEEFKKAKQASEEYQESLRRLKPALEQIQTPSENGRQQPGPLVNEFALLNETIGQQGEIEGLLRAGNVLKSSARFMTEAQMKTREFQNALVALGVTWETVGTHMGSVFNQVLSTGEVTIGNLLKLLAKMVIQFAAALVAATAFRAVLGDTGAAARGATAAGAVKGFFGGLLNIPQLAEGGIATSPTLAMIGEGSESEAVLPLSKLGSLMGMHGASTMNNINVTVRGRLDGQDILISGERAKNFRNRLGG